MANQLAPVIEEELGLGDHAGLFFKTNGERLGLVIPYVVHGLQNSERCMYIADENTVPDILAELAETGIDVGVATANGALSVVTRHDSYLRRAPTRLVINAAKTKSSRQRDRSHELRTDTFNLLHPILGCC